MLIYIWTVAIAAAIVLYYRQYYSRFHRYGVKHFTLATLIKNFVRIMFRLDHFVDDVVRGYTTFPGEKFVGKYELTSLVVVLRDIDLIKKIAVKDFEYFLDHRFMDIGDIDPLFGRNLFSLKGDEWKDMRSTLSPAFTSSKIRVMVPFMVDVGGQMIEAIKSKIKASGVDYIDIDVEDLTTRYANDVIATCAFGLKVDSHADDQNQFYLKGKELTKFGFRQFLIFIALVFFPRVLSYLKISLFSEGLKSFFKSLVINTMQDREERNIVRPDMIHLLMQAKKGKLTHESKTAGDADAGFATVEESVVGKKCIDRVWTDNDFAAQALLFFLAGFATVSSTMSFLMHELAVYPEVQEKLMNEIRENEEKNGGKFDYNSVQHMTYLDMVISEVLRLWPPAVALDRLCTKNYNLGKPNEKSTEDYIMRAGDGLAVPVWAIHRDPEYFPNPLKFDPERFSEQNKHNIKPFTYMPFGLGPRNCIGSRFALCEVKVMAYQLLQSMEVLPAGKTQATSELSKESFTLKIKGGHWVRLKVRMQA